MMIVNVYDPDHSVVGYYLSIEEVIAHLEDPLIPSHWKEHHWPKLVEVLEKYLREKTNNRHRRSIHNKA